MGWDGIGCCTALLAGTKSRFAVGCGSCFRNSFLFWVVWCVCVCVCLILVSWDTSVPRVGKIAVGEDRGMSRSKT